MSEIDDLTSQLRTLFGDNPESNPLFREMAKKLAATSEGTPKRVIAKKQPPVTIYTEVTIHYHCTHCGAERKRTVQLQKGESLTATKLNGCVEIINSRSPAVVDSYCGVCERCQDFVRDISREELEDRYLSLLASYPFPQVHGLKSYVQKMNTANTHDGEEVILSDAKI